MCCTAISPNCLYMACGTNDCYTWFCSKHTFPVRQQTLTPNTLSDPMKAPTPVSLATGAPCVCGFLFFPCPYPKQSQTRQGTPTGELNRWVESLYWFILGMYLLIITHSWEKMCAIFWLRHCSAVNGTLLFLRTTDRGYACITMTDLLLQTSVTQELMVLVSRRHG